MLTATFLFALMALFGSAVAQPPTTPAGCPATASKYCLDTSTDGTKGTSDYLATSFDIFYVQTAAPGYTVGDICGVANAGASLGAVLTGTQYVGLAGGPVTTGTQDGITATNKISFDNTDMNNPLVTLSIGVNFVPSAGGATQLLIINAQNVPNAGGASDAQLASGQIKVSFTPVGGLSTPIDQFTLGICTPTVVGDPQFVGLRGQSYQIHGVDGSVYNIISDKNLQVNSKFVFLTEGVCPMFDGVADTNCWSHPGSYMGELSFQAKVDGKLHAALLTSGSAKQGFAAIQMDGKNVKVGEQVSFGSFSLTAVTSHKVVVATEQFTFELTNSDMFINQALTPKIALSKMTAHGLLGQTHVAKTYSNSIKYIEGEVDDYVIADNDIFGDDFVYNQFQA